MSDERQAIVLIHGIGERRPMDTLRSFLSGIGEEVFYNKPDRLSGSAELRRYTLPSTRSRPLTDCFELYWSHHFERGKFAQTLAWMGDIALLRAPFWKVGPGLRLPLALVQILVLVLVVGVVVGGTLHASARGWSETWSSAQALCASGAAFWPGFAAIAVALLGGFVTGPLAQAARYMTPNPSNVEARNKIRSDGIELITRLHNDGRYQRIVVVGHNLGSVIGLDVLRLSWDRLRMPEVNTPGVFDGGQIRQPEASEFRVNADAVTDAPSSNRREAYQQSQLRLWRENRRHGVRWLVTDFVTLGSPLAHASLLLDTRSVKLAQRQREGEYPTCPPVDGSDFRHQKFTFDDGRIRDLLVGDHSAVFASVRWTNLYVPIGVLQGDPIGGEMAPEFGAGVRDIPVTVAGRGWRRFVRSLYLASHTNYWTWAGRGDQQDVARRGHRRLAPEALIQAMNLDIRAGGIPYPPPPVSGR